MSILIDLIKTAKTQVAQYPQYKGNFAIGMWEVVEATRDQKTKMGLVVAKGEKVLARCDIAGNIIKEKSATSRFPNTEFITVWSNRNEIATSVRAKHFTHLKGV